MKWLVASIVGAVVNTGLLGLFGAGHLGRTPPVLLLLFAGVSVGLCVVSIVFAAKHWRGDHSGWPYLASVLLWLAMVGLNLRSFQHLMEVI